MKKIIRTVAMALCACTLTFSTTSCDNEELMEILGQVVSELLKGQGTTYNFTGTTTGTYAMVSTDGGKNFLYLDEKNINGSLSLTLPTTIGTTSTIQFPAMNVNGISFPQVTVSGLTTTASSDSVATIEVGDNTTATGSITVDGVTYEIYNVFTEGLKFTTNATTGKSTLSAKTIQLWFGTPETKLYVLNFAYSGSAESAAQ